MTSQQFLLCDNSTVANFVAWGSAVSNFIRSAGWTNSTDTGQLNGAGAANWAGVTTVPGSGLFYYEIFQPGDGLQNFYLKLEYGNSTGTNSPTMAVTIGTGTNGAGTLTGFFTTRTLLTTQTVSTNNSTPFECNFSGNSGQLAFMMWRNGGTNDAQFWCLQRSLNASGSPYGTSSTGYVTVWTCGAAASNGPGGYQQSLVFGVGVAPAFFNQNQVGTGQGWGVISIPSMGNWSFNQTIALYSVQPMVGFFDYPSTILATANADDLTEAIPFSVVNQYGQTKTYYPSKATTFARGAATTSGPGIPLCMEWD